MTGPSGTGSAAPADLVAVAENFARRAGIVGVDEYGSGNINDTFLVTLDAGEEKHFILQRINTGVFCRPELVMRNMRVATEHIRRRLDSRPFREGRRWEVPYVIPTVDGRNFLIAPDGSFWRAARFIEGARSFRSIQDIDHAREVGWALGVFHALLSDLPPEKLEDTLAGFHITPLYLRRYGEVLLKTTPARSPEMNYARKFVDARRPFASVLEDARAEGKLILRPIHGDPKVDNVMLDVVDGRAVGLVDLDTVKPGLVQYDIGDCLRSACNPLGEEMDSPDSVRFDLDLCRGVLTGWLPEVRDFLTGNDYESIFPSIRLIAFELGLRFLTDYLEGNVYFKVKHREHNLARALIQFRLTESVESLERSIRSIVRDLRASGRRG